MTAAMAGRMAAAMARRMAAAMARRMAASMPGAPTTIPINGSLRLGGRGCRRRGRAQIRSKRGSPGSVLLSSENPPAAASVEARPPEVPRFAFYAARLPEMSGSHSTAPAVTTSPPRGALRGDTGTPCRLLDCAGGRHSAALGGPSLIHVGVCARPSRGAFTQPRRRGLTAHVRGTSLPTSGGPHSSRSGASLLQVRGLTRPGRSLPGYWSRCSWLWPPGFHRPGVAVTSRSPVVGHGPPGVDGASIQHQERRPARHSDLPAKALRGGGNDTNVPGPERAQMGQTDGYLLFAGLISRQPAPLPTARHGATASETVHQPHRGRYVIRLDHGYLDPRFSAGPRWVAQTLWREPGW